MADDNKKKALDTINKLKVPAAILATSSGFTAVYSAVDLIRHFGFGYPLREITVMITATMGVVSMIAYFLLGKGISRIRQYLS